MPISAKVLFDIPRRELASVLRDMLARSIDTKIVTGFATVEGVAALEGSLSLNPGAVQTIVIGAGTYRAYEAMDELVGMGVPKDRLFVHLGHTRLTGDGARHRFYRYHPMLHSKVYYTETSDGIASAIVGSHNMTGFALAGLNGEAGVLLEGDKNDQEFEKIRAHIEAAKGESVPYDPAMKDAFAWWTHEFVEGLADKSNDAPRKGDPKKTIVIICEKTPDGLPKKKDSIYFELPSAIGTVQSLRSEVHVYVFDQLPPSPEDALANLDDAVESYWCKAIGLEMASGGVELKANWYLPNLIHPELRATPRPFRPKPSPVMQQVRVEVYYNVKGRFQYLFEAPPPGWIPELDESNETKLDHRYEETWSLLDLVPEEHRPWFPVKRLIPVESADASPYREALEQLSPKSGAYILMSLRRLNRDEQAE